MSSTAPLFERLDRAVRQTVAAGDIAAARSIRLHVGTPANQQPDIDTLLALCDAVFACDRQRMETLGGERNRAILCVWERGQIATISSARSEPAMVVLTVLGQGGALHFQQHGS